MIFQRKNLVIGFSVFLVTLGCSTHRQAQVAETKPKETSAAYVDNSAALEAGAHSYVEIEFDEGSASLSDRAKMSLNNIIKEARSEGKIDEVIVLSWSDKEYPSKDLKELSKSQRELANKRNSNIEQYVKSMRNIPVNTYNMAERPTAFSKLFNTADTKLKNSLLRAGLSTTADDANYADKASHAVVLVKMNY